MHQILQNFKIKKLNDMQLASIDANKKNNDVILVAPTGSGKTLAFLLPLISIIDANKKGVQVLIIAPSRELAIQIEQVFKTMATGFKVNCCYGGHSTKTERNNLEEAPTVLIGTPGRLCYHINRKHVDTSTIETLIIDEFDKGLEFGFQDDMESIVKSLPNLKKRILTSATNSIELPDFMGLNKPVTLNYFTTDDVPSKLEIRIVKAEKTDKLDALFNLICKIGNKPTIVFCNHREAVDRISDLLHHQGLAHDVFHGGMEQDERERALIKFRNGSHSVLISTDLAARGLDIPEIEYVIHYQLPLTIETYTHRNGRTARMHAKGVAYLILGEEEYQPKFITEKIEVEKIEATKIIPPPPVWETLYISVGKKEKVNKIDIVGLLLQKGNLQKDELGLIEVLDHCAFAAVKRTKIQALLQAIKNEKLKGKSAKISVAK
jgi:ATP-independent RNA helicase DbpA